MLTLICGLPNAGKTTLSRRFANVVQVDEVRRRRDVLQAVAAADDVCVEGVFERRSERLAVLRAYEGTRTRCILVDESAAESIARERRGRPAWALRACAQRFERPSADEGWGELLVL